MPRSIAIAFFVVGCKDPPPPALPKEPAMAAYTPTRLDWSAVETQGVFASVLAAHGKREWVWVQTQAPKTLVLHLVPVDALVNMPDLQRDAEYLKSLRKPDPDGWNPEIEVRIEVAGSGRR